MRRVGRWGEATSGSRMHVYSIDRSIDDLLLGTEWQVGLRAPRRADAEAEAGARLLLVHLRDLCLQCEQTGGVAAARNLLLKRHQCRAQSGHDVHRQAERQPHRALVLDANVAPAEAGRVLEARPAGRDSNVRPSVILHNWQG